jgi:pyruvate dehydrogenase E2 component (dihydrolipoamide acetyltransferase)
MPALEMAQETGRLLRWLKNEGERVTKGEPIMEVETDKVTVEIPSPGEGLLGGLLIKEGDEVPVGQTIGWLLAPGEKPPASVSATVSGRAMSAPAVSAPAAPPQPEPVRRTVVEASPLARKVAEEHGIDLSLLKSNGKRIEKADVLAFLQEKENTVKPAPAAGMGGKGRLIPASPKARRLAAERGVDLAFINGSGPEGAVLAGDVPVQRTELTTGVVTAQTATTKVESLGTVWRVMAEHMSESWKSAPHFYLAREVDAGNLLEWRKHIMPAVEERTGVKPTVTDLLLKLTAHALRKHPQVNASHAEGGIRYNQDINIGIAVAIDEGLIVPVIHGADLASIGEIAARRKDLVERAQNRKLRPVDVADGTFTISNLGMFNVDAFQAIVNTPQAAILAVGRIADRVVPLEGQVVIRPMMVMTLSFDHRVVDGARGAKFLDELANLIEHPLNLLV